MAPPAAEVESVGCGALHQRMVERYAPPSLIVGPGYKVVHLSKRAGRYLVHLPSVAVVEPGEALGAVSSGLFGRP